MQQAGVVGHMLQIAVIPAEPWVTETISAVTFLKKAREVPVPRIQWFPTRWAPDPVVNRVIVITAIINDLING